MVIMECGEKEGERVTHLGCEKSEKKNGNTQET